MIADCKMIEFDIGTGENKAASDKLKRLLNAGYDVEILYGAKTVLFIGTKEGAEEEIIGGSDTDDTLTGGSDSDDSLTGGEGTDTVVGG